MKAKDVLLLTTNLEPDDFVGARGARLRARVRETIERTMSMGLNVIVVLGTAGDELLRTCPELESCDIAYDPNYTGRIFSSIHAGLHAATGAAFILPLEHDFGSADVWNRLDSTMWSLRPDEHVDVLQVLTQADGDTKAVFPQLVTLKGLRRLRDLPAETDWATTGEIRYRLVERFELPSAKTCGA